MKIIPYYRVSTQKQGQSGLGLEAQESAVRAWAKANNAEVVPGPAYIEVESGRKKRRPVLLQALSHCRAVKAALVVAKLDRLARNVAFLSALMESGVNFIACDNPHATKLTLHILAAVAEDEADKISQRTKDALAAYKRRGGKLGAELPQCRNLTTAARQKGSRLGVASRQQKAAAAAEHVRPIAVELRQQGGTYQAIADHLNANGYTTTTGKPWGKVQVLRLLAE